MSDFHSCQFILIRRAYIADRLVSICARSNVTFEISLHEVYVRARVRYAITKFSRIDSLPNFRSLRSKCFQSSYCAKVRAGAKKKKVERGGEAEKRKRLPANPTILENAP